MQDDLYWIDGDKLQRLLLDRGWKQSTLKTRANLSPRTVAYIVNHGRPVTCQTARRVAEALGVALVELGPRLDQSPGWWSIPELSPKQLRRQKADMEKAVAADMKGEHAEAVQMAEAVLAALDRSKDLEAFDAVFVRLLAFLDHATEQNASVSYNQIDQRIRDFETTYGQDKTTSEPWITYQHGICLRKLRHWDDARAALESLLKIEDTDLQTAATHQLAVVDLEEAKASKSQAKRKELLNDARKGFEKCEAHWNRLGVHRAGFSLRRLGELEQLCGNRKLALSNYLAALQIFAHHGCDRYAENTRHDIERLFSESLLPARRVSK